MVVPARAFALAACVACLAGLAPTPVAAVELGRLFFSPEDRDRLERLRRGEPVTSATVPAPAANPAITGFVKRSDGRHTIWIDGRPMETSDRRAEDLHAREVRDDTNLPPSAVKRMAPPKSP